MMRKVVRAWPLLVVVAALLLSGVALARPGGGSSYSGGGSSGGSGGGSSDSGIIFYVLWLCVEHPYLGLPLLVIIIIVAIVRARARKNYNAWNAGAGDGTAMGAQAPAVAMQRTGARRTLEGLRATDQNFSFVLFEDFLYALYAEVHTARGRAQLPRLSAYLDPTVVAQLQQAQGIEVRNIVIGAMRLMTAYGAGGDLPEVTVHVEFQVNYTEVPPAPPGAKPLEQSYYVVERWTLTRKAGVQSRTPERARIFGCPNCGAPQDHVISGTCRHCNQVVSSGAFDWVVRNVMLVSREARGPMLTGDTAEVGTDDPTIVDPEAQPRFASLQQKDAQFNWQQFQGRVALIFNEFQVAWSTRDLMKMRPFMSDLLFQTQAYWVETYKKQGLRNITENPRILGIQLARVTADRFYDAVTVRVYASSLDYTIRDADNAVVSGSRSKERRYTEYWTLVRGTNRKGPTRTDPVCPSCGAPMKINMVGKCEYCNAKVTSGDFDWVLSRIEQDEVYEG